MSRTAVISEKLTKQLIKDAKKDHQKAKEAPKKATAPEVVPMEVDPFPVLSPPETVVPILDEETVEAAKEKKKDKSKKARKASEADAEAEERPAKKSRKSKDLVMTEEQEEAFRAALLEANPEEARKFNPNSQADGKYLAQTLEASSEARLADREALAKKDDHSRKVLGREAKEGQTYEAPLTIAIKATMKAQDREHRKDRRDKWNKGGRKGKEPKMVSLSKTISPLTGEANSERVVESKPVQAFLQMVEANAISAKKDGKGKSKDNFGPVISHDFMHRCVKKVLADMGKGDLHVTVDAINLLQEAVTAHGTDVMQLAQENANTEKAGRAFKSRQDAALAAIKKGEDPEKTIEGVFVERAVERAREFYENLGLTDKKLKTALRKHAKDAMGVCAAMFQKARDECRELSLHELFSVPVEIWHFDTARKELQRRADLESSRPQDFDLGDYHITDAGKRKMYAKSKSDVKPLKVAPLPFRSTTRTHKTKKSGANGPTEEDLAGEIGEEDEQMEDYESESEDESEEEESESDEE
jgi:hypothetical protein